MNELTYPISPDYVKSWTPARAIAELIANALDEDPHATATWADGVLTIEDNGPGIPEEGMVLGYSPKGENDIGQFGEGAKIASLVLARAPEIGAICVQTVGYGFIPRIEARHILHGLAPRRTDTPPQVLIYTFTASDRTAGTRITIECDQDTAAEAIGRFRALTEPGYVRPHERADILLTGAKGRLYIGGVLVSVQPKLTASYDFPLAAAKHAQNRDRTVIDAAVLTDLVRSALAASTDPDIITAFASAALDRKRLAEPERYFRAVADPRVKAAFLAVGRTLFEGRSVFYIHPGVDESALALLDGEYEMLTTNLDEATHDALMRLLGVDLAKTVTRERPDHRAKTTYIAVAKLPAHQRAALTQALATTSALFGKAAYDKVKVFTDTGDRYLSCADGFYEPAGGAISVRQNILDDPTRTLEVVLHEVAHRRAHQRGIEYADRSRGFENELCTMLAALAAAMTAPDGAFTAQASTVAGAGLEGTQAPVAPGPEADIPATRRELAALLADVMPGALKRAGVSEPNKLSDHLGLHRNYLKLLTQPHPASWRTPQASMAPSCVSSPAMLEVLAGATGIRLGALWLGHMLCEAPTYGRRATAKPGTPWSSRVTKTLAPIVADLAAGGGVYAAAAERVQELADGADVETASENWMGFALDVLAAERARLGLDPTSQAPVPDAAPRPV